MPSQVMRRFTDIHKAAVRMARQPRVTAWRINLYHGNFPPLDSRPFAGELPGHIALYLI
jgi:hypothetical protein